MEENDHSPEAYEYGATHVCDENCEEAQRLLEQPLSTYELNAILVEVSASVRTLAAGILNLSDRLDKLEAAAAGKGASDVRFGQYL